MVHPRGVEPRIAGYKPVATYRITLGAYKLLVFPSRLSQQPWGKGGHETAFSRQSYLYRLPQLQDRSAPRQSLHQTSPQGVTTIR